MAVQDMAGRVALVAGGAGGIGTAICYALARRGCHIFVADLSERRGRAVAEDIGAAGGTADYLPLDAGDAASWARCADALPAGRLDYLVTAFFSGRAGGIGDMAPEGWDECFRATADGVFLGMRALAPHIGAGGAIVNIASVAAHSAAPQNIGYSAAKAAVVHLSRSVALDLAARRIRVNVVTPGMIRTRALEASMAALAERGETLDGADAPLGGIGEPDDIAQAVAFLCSDAARYVTGAELVVDGGLTLGRV